MAGASGWSERNFARAIQGLGFFGSVVGLGVLDRGWPRKWLERRADPNAISREQFKVWDF